MRMAVVAIVATVFVSSTNLAIAEDEGPTPEDITFVQGLLARMGYDPGPADGICGDLTAGAVRAFHKTHNFPLQPSDIEPQAATVVKNLTAVFAKNVMQPAATASDVYHAALAGDADAARDVGEMYHLGQSVIPDKMLAYLWWSVAETHGNAEAGQLKESLAATGEITDHEMGYATALAKEICDAACTGEHCTSSTDDMVSTRATM